MQVKISVIMPVYKAESYIKKSLDSMKGQSFNEWECVLVDDGSPDLCGAICDAYAKSDSRFKVLHQENGGVAAARQAGLEKAAGEYVIHVDPDDWIEPLMLEKLYHKAVSEKADMVLCDFFQDYGSRSTRIIQEPMSCDSASLLHQMLRFEIHGSCCNKLIRRDAIEQWDIQFEKRISLWEDLWFHTRLLQHPMKISYLPEALYHYVQGINGNSMRSVSGEAVYSITSFIQYVEANLNSADFEDELYRLKERCLDYVFVQNRAEGVTDTYPEIEDRYLRTNPLALKKPVRSAIGLAFRGYPSKLVWRFYTWHQSLINILVSLKKKCRK